MGTAASAHRDVAVAGTRATDIGLVRVLGVIMLFPILSAGGASPSRVAAVALGLVAIGAYLVALAAPIRSALLAPGMGAAILLCGVLAHLLAGQSWVMMGTAAALLCAVTLPALPLALAGVACCAVLALAMGLMQDAATTLVVVAGPGAIAALRHRLLVTIAELESAREQLAVTAVGEERERFSDDLHDVLGHSLSVIVVAAQVVQRTATDPDQVRDAGRQIETIGRQALDDVRAIVLNYRSRPFQEEVDDLRQALATAGIEARFEAAPADLPTNVEPLLALVLREAVTNVIRHSRATACEVRLRSDASHVILVVTDDGLGGLAEAARAHEGLATIRSRVGQLGGDIEIEPVDPHGLRLRVAVPRRAPIHERSAR